MAAIGYVLGLINGIGDDTTRNALTAVFNYVMRQGAIGESNKATNFAWFKVSGQTPAVTNTEFSIAHGLGVPPTKFIPVVSLERGTGLVPLTVSRTPDDKRVYFTSSVANAGFSGFLE